MALLWFLHFGGDRNRRLSEVKVEEGMEPLHINGLVVVGHMSKQGA